MEEALRTLLLQTTALSALVGTRVDWGIRPQGSALPAVVLSIASGLPDMTFSGPAGWSRARARIECWGRTYFAAKAVAKVIGGQGGRLVGFRGEVGDVRLRTFVAGTLSDSDSDSAGPVHRTVLDVMVWHDV